VIFCDFFELSDFWQILFYNSSQDTLSDRTVTSEIQEKLKICFISCFLFEILKIHCEDLTK
jgi:hypothetical protein